jgi:hypothetical protein
MLHIYERDEQRFAMVRGAAPFLTDLHVGVVDRESVMLAI